MCKPYWAFPVDVNQSNRGITDELLAEMVENGEMLKNHDDGAYIRRLSLASNEITDITPLSELTDLVWLSLNGNNIKDVSALSGLVCLDVLDLRNNPISMAQIDALQEALPFCLILYSKPLGHILGNKTIGINDALQVMMYLANIQTSKLFTDEEAFNAALITGKSSEPSISDVLQILMYIAKIQQSKLFNN